MSFSGKPTYAAGADLPEIAEDVSDIIGMTSPPHNLGRPRSCRATA